MLIKLCSSCDLALIFLVQIYVDDIIFGGSSHALVSKFSEQMSREFEMSMMGELQFFFGLQIKQTPQGTFVHQAKYTRDLLRKFDMSDLSPQPTPISTSTALDEDLDGEAVDQKEYRSMIGSLLYLTATRPDIQFGVGLCARYQASPRTSHRQVVKRIFMYLKFTPEFGLWYSVDSLWFWWAFLMPISVGVGWIASRLLALVTFSVHRWFRGPLASRLA